MCIRDRLSAGLNYLDQGYTLVNTDTLSIIDTEISRKTGQPMPDEDGILNSTTEITILRETTLQSIENISNVKTLQLPLMLGYQKQFSKVDLSLSAGLGINYAIGNGQFLADESKLTFSGVADFQVGYKLSERSRIFCSFFGGRHLSNLMRSDIEIINNSELNHFGLRAGVSYLL